MKTSLLIILLILLSTSTVFADASKSPHQIYSDFLGNRSAEEVETIWNETLHQFYGESTESIPIKNYKSMKFFFSFWSKADPAASFILGAMLLETKEIDQLERHYSSLQPYSNGKVYPSLLTPSEPFGDSKLADLNEFTERMLRLSNMNNEAKSRLFAAAKIYGFPFYDVKLDSVPLTWTEEMYTLDPVKNCLPQFADDQAKVVPFVVRLWMFSGKVGFDTEDPYEIKNDENSIKMGGSKLFRFGYDLSENRYELTHIIVHPCLLLKSKIDN